MVLVGIRDFRVRSYLWFSLHTHYGVRMNLHVDIDKYVDDAIEQNPLVFQMMIARTADAAELAVHAIVHDEEEAEHTVNILRAIANEIESNLEGAPNDRPN